MMNFVVPFICMIIGFGLMGFALHLCQYKRRGGCCAGGIKKLLRNVDSCQNPTGNPEDCPCRNS